jgi:hypothetical protein
MDWLEGHFTAEELAPEDLARDGVYSALVGDAKHLAIFGRDGEPERLHAFDVPPKLDDPRMLPDCNVSPFAGADTPRPGFFTTTTTIYITYRYLWGIRAGSVAGKAGPATLLRHTIRLLSSDEHLRLSVLAGDPPQLVALASRSNPGPVSYSLLPIGRTEGIAFAITLPWEYEMRLDYATQRPLNVVNAGG